MLNQILEGLKRQIVRVVLGLLVLSFFLLDVSGVLTWRFIEQMENSAYDFRLNLTKPDTVDPRIVIIDIDERSLAKEGRWPWGRDRVALLIEQLFEKYEIGILGFDVVFAEPDDSSGLKVLESLARDELAGVPEFSERLQRLRPKLDNDQILADTIEKYPVVMGYFFDSEGTRAGKLPAPTFVKGSFKGKGIAFERGTGFGANLAVLQDNAKGAGHFIPTIDIDGIVRRVPVLYEFEGAHYEALALTMARLVLGVDELVPKYEPIPWGSPRGYSGLEWLKLGKRLIPVDQHVRTLVPYRGTQPKFPYISAADVLSGTADPELLKDTIALVGTTAAGLLDLRATPVQKAYPGVEIHANLISGILDGRLKEAPPYTLGAEFIILTVTGLVMALVLPMLTPVWATAVTAGLAALSIALNVVIWQWGNLVMPIASGLMMLALMFLINMSYGYFIETRGKRELSGLFGHYIPPELVDEMSRDPSHYSLEADSRELTVLFSDVRGFTTISEGLPPKELADLMNGILTPLTTVIHDHRGTIDKYMGDCVMAFWGAPIADPEHARHALVAGLDMLKRVDDINIEFKKRGWPEIRIGVGINTGTMNVGNMGSEFRMAYTVLGDAVNLGSRLEGLTKSYGVAMMVSESTRAAVPEYAFRELDRVRVKGKDKPVGIYEPLGHAEDIGKSLRDELKLYRQALKYYRSQDWDMAELQFLNLQKTSSSPGLYAMYATRVAHFRANPPEPNWDGVFTHTSK